MTYMYIENRIFFLTIDKITPVYMYIISVISFIRNM